MTIIRRWGIALATLFSLSAAASGSPITYTDFGTGSGALDGQSFSNALVTLSFSGDTANIVNDLGIFRNLVGTLSVSVAGIGTDTITAAGSQAFSNPAFSPPAAGLSADAGSILDTLSNALAGYQLGFISAVTGSAFINSGQSFTTAGGSFTINSMGDTTFQAIAPSAVPLPGALPLFATGLGALGLLGWRRKRKLAA